ncbi:MAG TPA: avidin/streptavidin family protein [Chloroflexia bacterium]|nr:avidin/streptavidin family protein [Chloroflexia bacterium]
MGISLLGIWVNELNSTLTIESVQSGVLSGTYATAVSAGACAQGTFLVSGVTDTDSGGHNIGFTVSWQNIQQGGQSNCHSVTAWSGQVFNSESGPCINAFWLLTVESDQEDSWAATHVGLDVFEQVGSRSAEAIAEKAKVVRRSHP